MVEISLISPEMESLSLSFDFSGGKGGTTMSLELVASPEFFI